MTSQSSKTKKLHKNLHPHTDSAGRDAYCCRSVRYMCLCKLFKQIIKKQKETQGVSSKSKSYFIRGKLQFFQNERLVATGSICIEVNNLPKMTEKNSSKLSST